MKHWTEFHKTSAKHHFAVADLHKTTANRLEQHATACDDGDAHKSAFAQLAQAHGDLQKLHDLRATYHAAAASELAGEDRKADEIEFAKLFALEPNVPRIMPDPTAVPVHSDATTAIDAACAAKE